jgi:4-amino-4-deoxy-L-arabinose transferase-like glycosyltransferase
VSENSAVFQAVYASAEEFSLDARARRQLKSVFCPERNFGREALLESTRAHGGDRVNPPGLTRRDYLLLALGALALFSVSPLFGRMLSGHESVQPQTSREMFEGGFPHRWLVPTVGGDVWLERPPVPMWFICGVYAVAGPSNSDAVARFAAVLVAVPIVLLVAGIAARLYGRGAGLAAGAIYATLHEVYSYSSNPEADIFLALIVTAVIAVFVRLEFPANPDREGGGATATPSLTVGVRPEPEGLFSRRPLLVAVFFALLGATNLAKGMIFGTAMAAIPIAGYLLWNRSRPQIQRYFWFWGFVIAALVALAWPLAVIGRHPDILQLWKEHYFGRLNHGYLREPWWYYAVHVPYVILPWTIPALLGLWITRKDAFAGPGPARFLWCWAILPPAVFSLSDGKHHHYLLQCIAPWAILSVAGTRAIWQFYRERVPAWLRDPLIPTAACGLCAVVALVAFGHKLPGGRPAMLAVGALVPAAAFAVSRSFSCARPGVALGGVVAVIAGCYAAWAPYQARYLEEYHEDAAFLREAERLIPPDQQVFVQWDWVAPLETFWVLYHMDRPGVLIRDPWQAAERAPQAEHAFILGRRMDAPILAMVGTPRVILESSHTRAEKEPGHRRVLYQLTFHRQIPPPPEDYIRHVRRTLW